MLTTEVQNLSKDTYNIEVNIAQKGYDQVYAQKLQELTSSVNLPGFRSGKAPIKMLKKQFGVKLHQDTVNELISKNYSAVFEKTGLTPALEPKLEFPEQQPEKGCAFSLQVVTWPQDIDVSNLSTLTLEKLEVSIDSNDVEDEISRLMLKGYEFKNEEGSEAKIGDKLNIDFVGRVDGEEFEGNSGQGVELSLGEGQFIADFEEKLVSSKAGDKKTLNVTFPEDYGFETLQGKEAEFNVVINSIESAILPENEKKLAELMQVADEAALRTEVSSMLQSRTDKQTFEVNRQQVFDTLMATYQIEVAEEIIRHDIREGMKSAAKKMRKEGVDTTPEMFEDEQMQSEARAQAEHGIKLSLLLQKISLDGEVRIEKEDIDAELAKEAAHYPESIRETLLGMIRQNEDKMNEINNRLQEQKVVDYIFDQAQTSVNKKTLAQMLSIAENNNESEE
ncbi:MAG: trigger factor [Mariprofundaceae bacterium]|nr:trigger factor [Mariprofundaceae bacterium]